MASSGEVWDVWDVLVGISCLTCTYSAVACMVWSLLESKRYKAMHLEELLILFAALGGILGTRWRLHGYEFSKSLLGKFCMDLSWFIMNYLWKSQSEGKYGFAGKCTRLYQHLPALQQQRDAATTLSAPKSSSWTSPSTVTAMTCSNLWGQHHQVRYIKGVCSHLSPWYMYIYIYI